MHLNPHSSGRQSASDNALSGDPPANSAKAVATQKPRVRALAPTDPEAQALLSAQSAAASTERAHYVSEVQRLASLAPRELLRTASKISSGDVLADNFFKGVAVGQGRQLYRGGQTSLKSQVPAQLEILKQRTDAADALPQFMSGLTHGLGGKNARPADIHTLLDAVVTDKDLPEAIRQGCIHAIALAGPAGLGTNLSKDNKYNAGPTSNSSPASHYRVNYQDQSVRISEAATSKANTQDAAGQPGRWVDAPYADRTRILGEGETRELGVPEELVLSAPFTAAWRNGRSGIYLAQLLPLANSSRAATGEEASAQILTVDPEGKYTRSPTGRLTRSKHQAASHAEARPIGIITGETISTISTVAAVTTIATVQTVAPAEPSAQVPGAPITRPEEIVDSHLSDSESETSEANEGQDLSAFAAPDESLDEDASSPQPSASTLWDKLGSLGVGVIALGKSAIGSVRTAWGRLAGGTPQAQSGRPHDDSPSASSLAVSEGSEPSDERSLNFNNPFLLSARRGSDLIDEDPPDDIEPHAVEEVSQASRSSLDVEAVSNLLRSIDNLGEQSPSSLMATIAELKRMARLAEGESSPRATRVASADRELDLREQLLSRTTLENLDAAILEWERTLDSWEVHQTLRRKKAGGAESTQFPAMEAGETLLAKIAVSLETQASHYLAMVAPLGGETLASYLDHQMDLFVEGETLKAREWALRAALQRAGITAPFPPTGTPKARTAAMEKLLRDQTAQKIKVFDEKIVRLQGKADEDPAGSESYSAQVEAFENLIDTTQGLLRASLDEVGYATQDRLEAFYEHLPQQHDRPASKIRHLLQNPPKPAG